MKKLQGIVGIILGIIVAAGPQTFLHVCGGGKPAQSMGEGGAMKMEMSMPCHNVPTAALITGILIILASAFALFTAFKKTEAKRILIIPDAALAVLGIVTIGIPTFIIGVCSAPHMHCHSVTRPALIVLGSLTVVLAVVSALRDLRKS